MADNTAFGSLAAGILRGFGAGQIQKKKDARQDKQDKINSEILKLKLQEAKYKQSVLGMLSKLPEFQALQGQGQGQQVTKDVGPTTPGQIDDGPKFGKSFDRTSDSGQQFDIEGDVIQKPSGPGVVDQMTQAQMNPMVAALLKQITGVDVPGALRLGETRRSNIARQKTSEASLAERITSRKQRQTQFEKSQTEVERSNKDAEKARDRAQDFRETEVVWKRRMIDGVEWDVPFTKHGNEITGSKAKRIRVKGKKGLSAETATKSQSMVAGIKGIKSLRKMITNPDGTINKKKLSQLKPIPFINKPVPDWITKMFSNQPPIGQQMFTLINQAYESLIRGESGAAVPQEELVRLANRYGIDWTQEDATINLRIDQLQTILSGAVKAIDPEDLHLYRANDVAKRVYSDGREETVLLPRPDGSMPQPSSTESQLPQSVISKLQEGQITTFSNGQEWTLQNGQPVRVD